MQGQKLIHNPNRDVRNLTPIARSSREEAQRCLYLASGHSKSNLRIAEAYLAGAEEHAADARSVGHPLGKKFDRQKALVKAEILLTEAEEARDAGNGELVKQKVAEVMDLMAKYQINAPDRLAQFI